MLPGPTTANASIDHFSRAVLVDALAIILRQLGINIGVRDFIELVNQKTVVQATPSRTQMSRKDAHKGKQYDVIVGVTFDPDWQISLQLQ